MLRSPQRRAIDMEAGPADCPPRDNGDRLDSGAILVIDEQEAFGTNLGRGFSQLGFSVWLERDFPSALLAAESALPSLVIMELKVAGKSALDQVDKFRAICQCRIVIATAYPAIATAVHATRMGVDGYLVKPVTPELVLSVLQSSEPFASEADSHWPSLDRTIWEYLNQMFVTAGSMSEAARRLGLDRRSLRRMLSKYPPAR